MISPGRGRTVSLLAENPREGHLRTRGRKVACSESPGVSWLTLAPANGQGLAAAPTLPGRWLVAYRKAVATAKLPSSPAWPVFPGRPPHLAPRGSSFPTSPSLWVHVPTPTPLRAPSPAPVLSLTTFDVSSDYFRKCHQASHKAHILGASLLGLRTDLPTQGTWIRSLLGELRFHMPWDK